MLNERFYGSSESTVHYFPAHLLSDNFSLSACPLLSLSVSCYKRMRLTSVYNNCMFVGVWLFWFVFSLL